MKKKWDSNTIKMIAIVSMTIDHITWLLFPGYVKQLGPILLHCIGRITCPIMCYCIAEGYHYTKNIGKYTKRLFRFALISHFAYLFASGDFVDWRSWIPFYYGKLLNQTSVLWSLAWGLVMLRIVNCGQIKHTIIKVILVILICLISFPSDWSCIASLCVLAFGTNRGDFPKQISWMLFYVVLYAVVYCFAVDAVYGFIQLAAVLSIPVLAVYNGERGKNPRINKLMKWFFYLYYPLHLLVIGVFRSMM